MWKFISKWKEIFTGLSSFAAFLVGLWLFYIANKNIPLGEVQIMSGITPVLFILLSAAFWIWTIYLAFQTAIWKHKNLEPIRIHYERQIRIIKQDAVRAKKILKKLREPLGDFFEYGGVVFEIEMHNPTHHQVRHTCRLHGHVLCPKCKIELRAVEIDGEFQWWCPKCEHKATIRGKHKELQGRASFRFRQELNEIEDELFRKNTQK